jgi:N-acetylglucosaminyl-diphospho-decaprenol L-rhamnosyltransferase
MPAEPAAITDAMTPPEVDRPSPRPAPSPDRTDVSVLVVNYNTAHLVREMWDALAAAQGPLTLQTIVVDNASRDDSLSTLHTVMPQAQVIANRENVGFGRANNQALAAGVRGRYVLLLNTDAFVDANTLSSTVAYMDSHPECGLLGVRLVGRDGELQPSCRYFPTPWNVFVARAGIARFLPKIRMVDDLSWDHASVRECDWVPGCYLLIRKEVIDQVGLFDPRYFLYYEEVDLCFAAKRAGWKVVYYPDTRVVHIGGESAKSDAKLTQSGRQIAALQIESELLYFRKNHGLTGVLASVWLGSLTDLILLAKHVLRGRGTAGIGSYFKHAWAVWKLFARTRWGTVATR